MATSKYEEIKQDIIQKIQARELQPGEKISSESELKRKYGVSSTTVVKAFNELVTEGYVYRIQGKGTFISKAKRGAVVKYFEDDYKYYDRYNERTEVISISDCSSPEIMREFDDSTEVKEIIRIKYSADNPIQLFITYIDSTYINGASAEQLKSIYDTVKNKTNISLYNAKFEENFQVAFPAPQNVYDLMSVTELIPLVHITQKTYSSDNKCIEVIHSYKKHTHFNITITSNHQEE